MDTTPYWQTIKWILIGSIPGGIIVALAIQLFGKDYAPSPTVLEYLYSSVFQGLAALVAVSIAIVVYVSDRLEKLMEVHLTDARNVFGQFESVTPEELRSIGYELMVERMGKWYADKVEPKKVSLDGRFAEYRADLTKKKTQSGQMQDSTQMRPFIDDFERLQSYESNLRIYDEGVSNLGRFQRALQGLSKLPKGAALALAWALTTIMIALVLLATVDSASEIPSSWAITVIISTLLSVVFMGLLFRTLLVAAFGGGRIRGFEETQMPDSNQTWVLIKEVRQFLFDSTDYSRKSP
jgi:hypothetical protein